MTTYEDLLPQRELLAKACRVMGKLELTKSTFGHISLRLPGSDSMLIRARGPDESGIRFTQADDIILVDFEGKKTAGRAGLETPKEVFIHSWIFKSRPEVQSVLHAHPATVMLFGICQKPLLPLFGAYDPSGLRLLTEGLADYPKSVLICNDELGKELADCIKGARACMMRGHGITTCGPSVEQTLLTAIGLNELADINYRARLMGDPQPISPSDIDSFDSLEAPNPAPYWRYYCRLTGEDA